MFLQNATGLKNKLTKDPQGSSGPQPPAEAMLQSGAVSGLQVVHLDRAHSGHWRKHIHPRDSACPGSTTSTIMNSLMIDSSSDQAASVGTVVQGQSHF